MVSGSSPMHWASVVRPTGRPANRVQSTSRMARSTLSRPSASTPNTSSPATAASDVMAPSARTSTKSRTRLSRRLAMRGVPRERSAMRRAPSGSIGHTEDAGRPEHDGLELDRVVQVEPADEPEPVAQRAGHQAGAGGGADQGEPGQVEADAPRRRALADQDVELEVLHRRVEDLLHGAVHAVDLVDEEDVALLEVGEQGGQVAGPDQHRPRRDPEPDAELGGDDAGQRRLAEARGAGEQQVVGGLLALERRLDDDAQVLGQLALADELVEGPGPEAGLVRLLGRGRHRVQLAGRLALDAGVHPGRGQHLLAGVRAHRFRTSSRRALRTSSSTGASASAASSAPAISSGA